jgi:hypothetical protein
MAEKYLFWLFMLVVAIRYQHATINMLSDTFHNFPKTLRKPTKYNT